jgi:hypothetical protein
MVSLISATASATGSSAPAFASVSGGESAAVADPIGPPPGAPTAATATVAEAERTAGTASVAPLPVAASPAPGVADAVAPPRGKGAAPGTVTVGTGGSTYINVSARMMNELVVPYVNPRIVKFLRPSSKASIQQDGSSIYVSTGNEEFIQLIVKNADVPSVPGFSVTLIPVEDIPGQSVVLKTAGGEDAVSGGASLAAADYVDLVRELMREAARETLPGGYARDQQWGGASLLVGPVSGRSLYRAVGTHFAVEYFELVNTGATGVELVEPNFAQKGVRAIAFPDSVVLAPGQSARMVWVRDR